MAKKSSFNVSTGVDFQEVDNATLRTKPRAPASGSRPLR